MCLVRYQPALNKAEGSLSFDRFARLIDGLPGIERVTLQGLGEPLLAPDLMRMVHDAAERGIRMGFNTNATLLKPQVAADLVRSGLGWLHISLDGATAATYEGIRDGARFELVRRNVRELVRIRRDLDSETPALSVVFVAMRRNLHELPDLVRTAAQLGIPDVWVQNLSHSFADTGMEGRTGRSPSSRNGKRSGRDPTLPPKRSLRTRELWPGHWVSSSGCHGSRSRPSPGSREDPVARGPGRARTCAMTARSSRAAC
jgi:MoaA/NifB/PqqE/SkfB family radical SAM enzyme